MVGIRRLLLVFAVLVLLAFSRQLFSLKSEAPTGELEQLTIVSPHWEGIRYEFSRAFEAEMAERGRNVRLVWLNPGGTSACLRFVRSRFSELPDGIGVDLFFGGGVEPFLRLAEEGLLEPVEIDPAILDALPQTLAGVPIYDAAAGWYGSSLTTFGIVYNKALLERLAIATPRSFGDLGEPEVFSWVGLADPRMSGTVHMIYELILQARGWEEGYRLITRMAANSRRIYHHAAEVPIETGASDIATGTSLDSYAWAQVEQLGADSIGFVAPEHETVMNPDGIAMLEGAPRADLAREFINFTLSHPGQLLWMLRRGTEGGPERFVLARMPVRPDVYRERRDDATVTIDPFAERDMLSYDPAVGSRRWTLLNVAVGSVLIDLHRELVRTWRDVIAAGLPEDALELMTRPPITEDEALRLTAEELNDPIARNRLVAGWARDAKSRFRQARKLARDHQRSRN